MTASRTVGPTLGRVVGRSGSDAPTRVPLEVSVRSGGIAAVLAGVFLVLASPWHPNVLDGDVARLTLETRGWAAIHLGTGASIVAGWWGVLVTVAAHRERFGRRGDAVVAVTSVGAFVVVAVMLVEIVAFPALARHAPELLTFDGPLAGSIPMRATLVAGGGYFAGLVGTGILLAGVPGWERTGRALSVTTVGYGVLGGVFVPVAGLLATVAFCGAQAWWGRCLLSRTPATRRVRDTEFR